MYHPSDSQDLLTNQANISTQDAIILISFFVRNTFELDVEIIYTTKLAKPFFFFKF
jgi:hypothetical protein